ncbi:MAG: hypothetical protein U0136_15565 [Bdellovibrionota bacterium]
MLRRSSKSEVEPLLNNTTAGHPERAKWGSLRRSSKSEVEPLLNNTTAGHPERA